MTHWKRGLILLLSLCSIAGKIAFTQSSASSPTQAAPCEMPAAGAILKEPNIFSEQQEEWLGDLFASQIEKQFKTVPDPDGYLQKLGERLLAQLPKSNIHYRFTIVDLPDNNSFGIPGGHIYVARRVIALAQNEDELAGLLGHEIGHIITRQPAIDLTRMFTEVLGVSQLGDREDVIARWNRFLDTRATKSGAYNAKQEIKREEEEQLIADRIALYAVARDGYQPSRYIEFFDRLAQTKGKKGNFWSDLFGRTSYDARRLRELFRNSGFLMQACAGEPVDTSRAELFSKWQKAVIASDFAVAKEAIPGLISKQTLNPPLRSDLRFMRFSPDGKYLMAQDEDSIYVLSANPVTNLFQVDAPDTFAPYFTPDSAAIVFYDKELRVQKWDMNGKRLWVHELALAAHCLQTALSHSGEVLACLNEKLEPQLIDVKDSALIYKGNRLKEATQLDRILAFIQSQQAGAHLFEMSFSPDDRYFVLAHENSTLAYDFKTNSTISLSNNVKDLISHAFTFLSPDEIAGYAFRGGKLTITQARFPSGEIQDSIPWALNGKLAAPDKGSYVLFLQDQEPAVMVLDWRTKKTALMYKKPGFAVYDDMFAGETAGGEVGLYDIRDKKYQSGVDLPRSPLSRPTAASFSPDGNWLAVSQATRGAVWNLTANERAFLTRGFDGAFFDQDALLAKFPKQDKEAAAIFRLDTKAKTIKNLYDLPAEAPSFASVLNGNGAMYWQQGSLLLKGTRPSDAKGERHFLMEVLDVSTNKKLWERNSLNALPWAFYSRVGHTVSVVVANYDDMKAEAKEDGTLSTKLQALANEDRRKASYIIEVLDDATGKELGKLLVDTGNLSFRVERATTLGDLVLVTDSVPRTLIYSLRKGELKGTVFGIARAISADGHLALVEDRDGKADLYDLGSLAPLVHYEFPSRLVHAQFLNEGTTVAVLTGDQTIYRLKLELPSKNAAK